MDSIDFYVAETLPDTPIKRPCVYLIKDNWNDWHKFRTQFDMYMFNSENNLIHIGAVKIGRTGMRPSSDAQKGMSRTELPPHFRQLEKEYFSLGQTAEYYERTSELKHILDALNDLVIDPQRIGELGNEIVFTESITRDITHKTIIEQFARVLRGEAKLTEYNFHYSMDERDTKIDFFVTPNSTPPTNIHILIGSNGVGKTTALNNMAQRLINDADNKRLSSRAKSDSLNSDIFSGLIILAFSAFDKNDKYKMERKTRKFPVSFVGLSSEKNGNNDYLATTLIESYKNCKKGGKKERLTKALNNLNFDEIFSSLNLQQYLELDEFEPGLSHSFKSLSSGHKIILLSLVKLVDFVEEKSLVLIDEPESHLHPPLLSAFLRSLSELLINRNGVAIIATHSPVVLQEVPASCVWTIQRHGDVFTYIRPEIETFGENTGTLTREIFGLQVTNSGYHTLLRSAVDSDKSYTEIVDLFNNQLGSEAKVMLRSLIKNRENRLDA